MKQIFSSKLVLIFLLSITALLSTGCAFETRDKLWMKSEAWSQAVLLGPTSMAAPAEMESDESGKVFSIIFPRSAEDETAYQPELVGISPDAAHISRTPLDLIVGQPRQADLILNESAVELFWIEGHQLYRIQAGLDGTIQEDKVNLSGEDYVDSFRVHKMEGGYQIWYAGSRENPGVYALSGELGELRKTTIDPLGTRISLLLDDNNHLHASWVEYPLSYGELGYFYLYSETEDLENIEPVKINSKGVSTSIRMVGPVLSLDDEVVYLMWSEEITSGLEAGMRNTFYRYFPLGEPDTIRPQMNFYVPASPNIPQVEVYSAVLETGNRVPMGGMFARNPSIENIYSLGFQSSETAIVFRSGSEFKWRDFRNQVNVGYLSDGLLTSFQPLSYTSAESYFPAISIDEEQYLYVTWLEKGEASYYVYLTTTDPAKKANLDLLFADDYLYLGAEGLFGILAGAVLSPFAAAAWGGIAMVGFIFNIILSQFNKPVYRTIGEVLSIIAGIGIFWFMKLATLPGLKTWDYVPFSAWIPRIPDVYAQPLIYGVPALIAGIALGVAYFNTYGKKADSAINFHLLYCAVDTLLSCAVYGVLIYGSF